MIFFVFYKNILFWNVKDTSILPVKEKGKTNYRPKITGKKIYLCFSVLRFSVPKKSIYINLINLTK